MLYRKWNVSRPDAAAAQALRASLGCGALLADVLAARGYGTPEEAAALLAEGGSLPDPFSIADMDKAVSRIRRAVEDDETIVIFGDYDVDGITATALLYTCLDGMGADVYYKLPSRSVDEYGLTTAVVEQVAGLGITLIVTVDNGVSAVDAVQRANELGVDVVITDHHLLQDTLPAACALVDPCRGDDDSGCETLCGAGVAFMLAAALEGCTPEELLPEFGDLVAIGTVADVMKLTGTNRTLVREGLKVLADTSRPGLALLMENCGFGGKGVTVENISYMLAPRLNAAGRMDDATGALLLLLADTPEEAAPMVAALQEQNTARQSLEQEIVAEITQRVDADPELQSARVLVVDGDSWHQGIVGIVSSRLVDKYAKPAIVISFEGDEGRGSGRSVAGFSLYGAIASCADLLTRFGGHDLAAGLSIPRGNLAEFRRRVNVWAAGEYPVPVAPEIKIDAPLDPACFTVDEVRGLDRLAPCGSGNPAPKFILENAVLEAVYPVSEGRHSRLRVKKGEHALSAVLFGTSPAQLAYPAGTEVDLLLSLSIYEGKGEPMVSARVLEVRPAGMGNEHVAQSALFESFLTGGDLSAEQTATLSPTRADTETVYRAVRGGDPVFYGDLRPLFARFGESGTARCLTALAALEELGVIRRDSESGRFAVVPVSEKRNLSQSSLLQRLEVSV